MGFISMFIGVAIGVIGKKLLHEEIVTVVGILCSPFGNVSYSLSVSWPSPRSKYDFSPTLQPDPASSKPEKHLPQGNLDYVPSVTERTTNLLKNRL